uniref:Uncharacterized protein n=1 Tax=Arion vulgaris TaxID=1028688 RepID=A0A0B7A3M2_9EUPU
MMSHMLLLQCATILLSVVLSAMVFFPLGTIYTNFEGQCILFSQIYIIVTDFALTSPARLDLIKTEFGDSNECDYTTFSSVIVTVVGIIFLWFLFNYGRVSEKEKSESTFLVSILFFYLVLFTCVVISSIKISSGFSYWCNNMNICVGTSDPSSNCKKLDCNKFSDLVLVDLDKDTSKFYTYLLLAEISSWLLSVTLLIECFITSQRIYQNIKASFTTGVTEKEKTVPKIFEMSVVSIIGIINQGSDDFTGEARTDQLSDSSDPSKRTMAEITVHQDNMALAAISNYEMSAIIETPDVQISGEAGKESTKKKQQESSAQENETESDKPRNRRRKTTGKVLTTQELNEGNKSTADASMSKHGDINKDNV